jgi:hypothetical protein
MAQAQVKIHNIDHLIYDSADKMNHVIKEDFQPYSIKCEIHRMVILENQNMTLCSLLFDTSFYEYNDKDRYNYDGLLIELYRFTKTTLIMSRMS